MSPRPPAGSTPLTRARVIAEALRLLDRDGPAGLTMRALGRELNVDPMAAYYHVPSKAALLDGVVEAVWSELDLPERTDEPWAAQLTRLAHEVRRTLRRHPRAVTIVASRPNRSLAGLRLVDRTLDLLTEAGLPAAEAFTFGNIAVHFLVGHALAEAAPATDTDLLGALEPSEAAILPHLTTALAATEIRDITADRIFVTGLAALIDAVWQRVAQLTNER